MLRPGTRAPRLGRVSRNRSAGRAARSFQLRLEPLERRFVLSSTVVGRLLFYNQSAFDGNDPAISAADDGAIASDKTAYLATGALADFSNISGYTRGINGLMVDLLGSGAHGSISAGDFVFRVGANNAPASWSAAPAPSALSVRLGAGISGSDRVEITWANGAIANQWLEVMVLPTANTGLVQTDVFFWGNKIGDTGSPSATSFTTTTADASTVIAGGLGGAGGVTNARDLDKSNTVTVAGDRAAALGNIGALNRATVTISAPVINADLANDTGSPGDGITTDYAISGTIASPQPITLFTASLNGGSPVDVLPQLSGGTFTLGISTMDTINGGPLADGPYTLHLRAGDAHFVDSFFDIFFEVDTSIGTPSTPDLTPGSDLGESNSDDLTSDTTPTIEVTAEMGSLVTLWVDGSPVAQQVAGPVAQFTLSALGSGLYLIEATAEDGAGNVSAFSDGLTIEIDADAPAMTATTLVTFSDDRTPHVTVTGAGLANNTQVRIDVDINNDGDFDDAGESNRTQALLYNGSAYFQIDPALPATNAIDGPYLVQIRARATDPAGNEGTSALTSLLIDTLGSDALADYVYATDPTSALSASPVSTIAGSGFTVYVYDLTSQTWRSASETNRSLWRHWLQIIVPTTVTHSTALLYVTGGSNGGAAPTTLSGDMLALGTIAVQRQMITAVLPTVPNQSMHFSDEAPGVNRSEDDIIAYTFNKFVNDVGPDVDTWPLLLPMVKSAMKAMDAVQAKDTVHSSMNVADFIVTGYSKRGWTTWLTGAMDGRVRAVIPGVIDLLNLDESMVHHYGFYGFFAEAVGDYQEFNLIQNTLMPANQELGRIVDPYRYLETSNLTTIPKLLLNSTGDEFFVPDSGQFYFSDIPGPKYVRYIPNTGHGLDSRATESTQTFTNAIVNGLSLPEFSWTTDPDGSLRVQTVTAPTAVRLWQATNPSARDFRRSNNPGINWTSALLADQGGGVYVGNVATPATGARAFMIELTFTSPIGGNPYVFTTEVRVVSNLPLVTWPFFMPSNPPSPGMSPLAIGAGPSSGLAGADQNALAFGLATSLWSAAAETAAPPPAVFAASAAPAAATVQDEATEQLFDDWSLVDELGADDAAADDDEEASDLALSVLGDAWE
ncbi:MAG: PhoPQ-activated protein PqaA family protein [Pirellulales bacterium]